MNVDDKWALIANQEWWEEDVPITTLALGNRAVKSGNLSDDGTFIYSGTGAVMRVKGCKKPDRAGHTLYTSIQVRASDLGNAPAMKKLATAYTKAVGNTDECS
ncbi:hypothetical protein [Streptomyces sp. Ag109_G2-15]|uniref:hypothetical protein n=1 Tax=Streptomyces sp. Ag109_G2-15 TaxID=1938850 RepID=UPI001180AAA9|nr:hypothetical protein [Streptomyces sp. Ag109_G2-15]